MVGDKVATDCESKKVAGCRKMQGGAGACNGVDRAAMNVVNTLTIQSRASSRPSEHDVPVTALISDNDSSVESLPVSDIKRSQVIATNSSTDGDDGSSEMEFHDEFSTPRKSETSVQMSDEEASGSESQNKKAWTKNTDGTYRCPAGFVGNYETGQFSPEQPKRRSSNILKRNASVLAKDTEALKCKKPKGSTPGTVSYSNGPSMASENLIEMTESGREIGSCIYAQWEDGGWHFATIYDVKRGPTPASTRYSVRTFCSRVYFTFSFLMPNQAPISILSI